jgi:multidrug efflux pump subunit AcrA (membrane-fusion protein)/biotin carboxyl carrier protein
MENMEQKPKKREWVKNAAIIFLAVMLVLTFFSNTILNRTLPEVVTRYVEPGSIDAKVRISGTVAARENYDVIIDQTRKVAAVNVRVGQEVHTGDLLFTLEPGDSEELEAAKKELQQYQIDYQRALLNGTDADYAKENRDIEYARAALERAIAKRDGLALAPEAIELAKGDVTMAEANVETADRAVKDYTAQLEDAQYGYDHSSDPVDSGGGGGNHSGLVSTVSEAQAALAQAENSLRAARLLYGVQSPGGVYYGLKEQTLAVVLRLKGGELASEAQERILAALDQELPSDPKITLTAQEREYADLMPYHLKELTNDYKIMSDAQIEAYSRVTAAKEAYADAAKALSDARGTLSDAQSQDVGTYIPGTSYEGHTHSYWAKEVERIRRLLSGAQNSQESAQDRLTKAKETLDALKTQQSEWEAAATDAETCQRSLEDLLFGLSEQQKADDKSQKLEALGRTEIGIQIEEAQKKVDKYSADTATEVRSKVNGTVASLTVSAGHNAEAEKALATIEVNDLGYTLSATVSTDQARLLHVGDTASVSNYYWGSSTTAELVGMQPDPKDPRSSRTLSFDLTGDVNAGDKVTFSIGEKNASYDLVVPNSAVRSDTNGSFVLMITAKNSPLGNRYFATRVEVEVIASDDFNTAVKGALSNMDSVITTSSGNAPVKNGEQVRLADMN